MSADAADLVASGEGWLAAAAGGGLPEPSGSRWKPLRVGIVSLWEYDDAEFWFADGRLVLRGGNGAGKTKVLELTTLMLLRGEIAPSVLDPFGSQHRTMRFNLLPTGEGDDPREAADSGLGYAWVEFGRRDETGAASFFVCGMGAAARRGTGTGGVTTWHFVTSQRPGKDFSLLVGGRAIEQKDLRKLEGVAVPPSAAAYRARLAADLFGLAGESFDNLTELLKQLRKPKLGERLNPSSLATMLRDALPPLAGHEVTQLADGWDQLEQLRRAVEQTEEAATAVAQFVRTGWRPWARVVLRRRADEFTAATTMLDNTTRDKNAAGRRLENARAEVVTAGELHASSTKEKDDRDTELRELLDSSAYKDAAAAAQRVDELRREVGGHERQRTAANDRIAVERTALETARTAAGRAGGALAEAERKVGAAGESLSVSAEPAGLAESVRRRLPARDVDALLADHATRAERFAHLRRLGSEHESAVRQTERSGQALEQAEEALAVASGEQAQAQASVEAWVETLRQRIRGWAAAARVAPCPDRLVEDWCEQVVELTVIDAEAGVARPGVPVTEPMRAHVGAVRARLVGRAEAARRRRDPVARRHAEVVELLAQARARTETSPPAPVGWARRERPTLEAGLGAPFWRLVNPLGGLDDERLGRLEADLAASGLLDAWLTPDGALSSVNGKPWSDVQPVVAPPPTGRTLLAVLEPDAAGGVTVEVVRRLLGGIGWLDSAEPDRPGDWLAAAGGWRVGGLTGRAEPARPASYLGAAARDAARRREIDRLDAELAELGAAIAELDGELAEITVLLDGLAVEERAIPADSERDLGAAVVTLADRSRRTIAGEARARTERERHAEALSRRDTAWARFADYAGEHRFGLRDLDTQATALAEFRTRLDKLVSELDLLSVRVDAAREAEERLLQQEDKERRCAAELAEREAELRRAGVRLAAAEAALGAGYDDQLRRRDQLDTGIRLLGARIDALSRRLTDAKVAAGQAETLLAGIESRRAEAEQSRDATMVALWAGVEADLAVPLGLSPPDRRTVTTAREFAAVLRREITVDARDVDEDRLWRRCFARMEELRQVLLPNRDARVVDDEDRAAGIQRIAVLTDPASGWQAPHLAAEALAERVREQRGGYDAEQQRVLTTLLGSTFIEHLKDRLDYTTHTFARINDQLARHPTRQGHLVRVQWEADPADPDANAVVSALGRGYQELSTERQDMVRAFLARKIDEARDGAAADGSADWKDELARALDYRLWLRLSLQYRPGVGSPWTVFDTARHAAKSGGEKVVLLSQPLFAAAVVAYDAAGPLAPRWVWLDEAMTGVDARIKASFMGLTVDFELDVMLTAHDEWCTYPTVPAVAVYDLARQEHIAGVDALPHLWCGNVLTPVDVARLGFAPGGVALGGEDLLADGLFGEVDG
ncbi:MAG: TIGR02680 family protein [Frankia sp.]